MPFPNPEFGGLGMQSVRAFWGAIKFSWLKHMYTSSDFWLELLLEKTKDKAYPNPTKKNQNK